MKPTKMNLQSFSRPQSNGSPPQPFLGAVPKNWFSGAAQRASGVAFQAHGQPEGSSIPLPRGVGELSNGAWVLESDGTLRRKDGTPLRQLGHDTERDIQNEPTVIGLRLRIPEKFSPCPRHPAPGPAAGAWLRTC